MEKQKKIDTQVTLQQTGEIELPQLDVSKYIGLKTKIVSVTEHKGEFGYFVKVSSEILDVIQDIKDKETGEPLKLQASRNFGLFEDEQGNIGWGKQTKLGQFLAKMKVNHYKELVGKEVIVQTTTNKNDGKDYLTF